MDVFAWFSSFFLTLSNPDRDRVSHQPDKTRLSRLSQTRLSNLSKESSSYRFGKREKNSGGKGGGFFLWREGGERRDDSLERRDYSSSNFCETQAI